MHSCLMLARCIRRVECGKACGYAADISCRRNIDERQRKQQKREICVSNTGIIDGATMNGSHQSPKRLLFAITLVFALPVFSPAQATVLTSGGFLAAYQELRPNSRKALAFQSLRSGEPLRAMDPPRSALSFATV